ncbi:MAG: ElyC/SanA/YdcF family protein [Candidatus Omnitrophota bacterium]|nr:ElyC/SanA/YdcF family protein [Candidatus Omnitrophota bacterium]
MLKNENIICISSIDWDFIWQGHQEIMSTFAKNGNRVLFIENTGIRSPTLRDIPRIRKRIVNWLNSIKGFRKETENLYIYSPLILPFPYSRIARWVNKYLMLKALNQWMKVMRFDNPIVWTFLPTGIALDIIHSVNAKVLIYYYIADFDNLVKNHIKLRKTEEKLIKECDIIFVQGQYFKEKCLKFNKNVFIFPFGVNIDVFENFKKHNHCDIPKDLAGIRHPVIGYIGGLHRHIDFDLIKDMAIKHPEWSIVMIGPEQTDISQIRDLKNIYLLGKKDFSQLPSYVNQFDVGIVPYLLTEYTETVYPTKVNEYHIMGKPVVSTFLPEVIKSDKDGLVLIAGDSADFPEKIKSALSAKTDKESINARISAARSNSWSNRIEEMSSIMEKEISNKNYDIPTKWQERFVGIYKKSRKRALKTASILVFLWVAIFYTPIIWYLAEPLKLTQKPQLTDAIVVFAGGVGETGQAGQGYEERVDYAVELYKKGFAKNLIFSSGAQSTFPEPYVMKVLAVSLGVPSDAIIFEDRAASTYENVKFSSRILSERGWKKIILISSPYHMRRASLVFRKIAPDKDVIYSSVANNQFYQHGGVDDKGRRIWKQINLEQIRAIIHEYTAICYYWLKGYI